MDYTESELVGGIDKSLQAGEEAIARALFSTRVGEAVAVLGDDPQMEGRHLFASQEWAKLTGYTIKELGEISFFDLLSEEYRASSIERHRQKISGDALPELQEMEIVRKDGARLQIELTSTGAIYQGKPVNIAFIRDITERKKLEESLVQYRNQLESMVQERTLELSSLNERLQQEIDKRRKAEQKLSELYKQELGIRQELERKMAERVQFTHALVHELKTPLTAIIASSEALSREVMDNPGPKLAGNIYRSACRLEKRVDELLDLAKSEVGNLKIECSWVEPLALIYSISDDIAPEVVNKGQELVADLPKYLPLIWADRNRLQQIILNLISNALKFNRRFGTIWLRAREEGDFVVFEVKDEGKGVAPEDQEAIFQPYFSLDNREGMGGLGLGLYLCKTLVHLHHGEIWVDSEIGKGASFFFSIPVAPAMTAGNADA